ncbi:unnamed protein product [Lupinus luteus]|uniref:Uncharacterized protein n=1 Tax=Lupinus luteus TaxID=3873 RepID=A0AAV1WSZ8_LUPLU
MNCVSNHENMMNKSDSPFQDKNAPKNHHQNQREKRSKGRRSAKLKGSTSGSSSHGVLSDALAMDSVPFSKSITSHLLSTIKQPVPLPIPNVLQQKKTMQFKLLALDLTSSLVEFALLPVMQPEGLPYGVVDDCAPSMALVRYAPKPQLGSGNCGVTSMIAAAAKPYNINKSLADRSGWY